MSESVTPEELGQEDWRTEVHIIYDINFSAYHPCWCLSRNTLFLGKSSSKPPERKHDKQDNSSEKATKELAENVANNRTEDGAEQKEKSCDSSLPKDEGNNNESNGVNGTCGDNPSTESNDLNAVRESKGEGGEETFTESEPNAVAICGS